MLREWRGVRQRPEEGKRRWFTDEDMDLIVWYSSEDTIRGFQLCYGKLGDQHAVTWFSDGMYTHAKVDDGESGRESGTKQTPILVQDGVFDARAVAQEFKRESVQVDPEIRRLVYDRLRRYPSR
ncbi:MAG: hypothetical protein ACOCZB_01890 [Spirochaetota bacterium]